jgi:hypothetical protein
MAEKVLTKLLAVISPSVEFRSSDLVVVIAITGHDDLSSSSPQLGARGCRRRAWTTRSAEVADTANMSLDVRAKARTRRYGLSRWILDEAGYNHRCGFLRDIAGLCSCPMGFAEQHT